MTTLEKLRSLVKSLNSPQSKRRDTMAGVLYEARREVAEILAEMEWRDISTAPRDGGDFIGRGDQHGVHIAYWAQWLDNICQEECEGWRDTHSLDRLPHLTHWKPLEEEI